MAVTANGPAPYAPSRAVLELVTRHRDRGLPAPVNADTLLRAGISESLITRTLQALQVLDLIDENGAPSPVFEGIRRAPQAEYKMRLQEWLKAAYQDVFAFVDPSKDDATQIRDAFRNYQPTGQQDRMVTLFTGLCAAAGLMPEKAQTAPPKSNGGATQTRRPPASPAKPKSKTPPPPAFVQSPTPGLPPALSGLLASLPNNGSGWTQDKRDKFIATFGAVIDFVYPIVEDEDQDDEGDADQ
ncbi:DUF5343 domain-containing protein [Aestuariivirga sp. YIM B02566]|uniref:DUF5343 domain-containing protein n=1 Tax=Taklimakanibacter albus TaxID=2800327 RepID=A0ACC5R602_9HYPH|nr:DUF5343 domain-containing protein [Aestuariivirga sp. YIM B02566]MBK1868092.1 DUF5343 domain-containing protein [Aestuariivirga sp. YIM B02566]